MNMFDEARTIDGMIKMLGMTQGEIAKKLGVSQSYVGNKVRLLGYSDEIQRLILEAGLSERHARTLLRIKDEPTLRECIRRAGERGLTVAECEAMVDVVVEAEAPRVIGRAPKNERISAFEAFLTSSLESLGSLGISTHKETSRYGNKRYITITIAEP